MPETEIFVLFGNQKSIRNYNVSVTYLIENTPSLTYTVIRYRQSNYKHARDFSNDVKNYDDFVFLSIEEFDTIYHYLCVKARADIKLLS